MKEENERFWRILRGECSLTEGLIAFGMDAVKTFTEMGTSIDGYFVNCNFIKHMAYLRLVHEGEIKADEVYNTGYGTNEKPEDGDFGFMGEKLLTYWDGKWC